jgi:chromate transporter
MSGAFALSDSVALFLHCLTLSLLAVGGGITLAPEFHRYLVSEKLWLTDSQFTSAIALAQSAPGPNIMYVGLLGWNTGFAGGGYAYALLAMGVSLLGILIPSTTLTLLVTRWAHRNRELRILRAFKQGMAPVVIALLLATVWLLSAVHDDPATDWPLWLLSVVAGLLVWKTRIHLLWLLGAGALLGGMGWV